MISFENIPCGPHRNSPFPFVCRKKINVISSTYKRILLLFSERLRQLDKIIKVIRMIQLNGRWLCFLSIYSNSTDTRSGSFSEMHGKLNKCKSGFHVDHHQAWIMSRIQSSVNERTILYLTADNLAQSGLLNFCLMQNVKNIPFQYVPTLLND